MECKTEIPLYFVITLHACVQHSAFPADPERCGNKSERKSPHFLAQDGSSLPSQNNSGQKAALHFAVVSFSSVFAALS